jgi:hypothetical protein
MNTKALAYLFVLLGLAPHPAVNARAMAAKRGKHTIARKSAPPSAEEVSANRIEAGLGHCQKIVKMLKTGTDRAGVLIGYVPAGPTPIPCKVICDVEFPNKSVLDEYYYASGHLIFVRETVCTYVREAATGLYDIAHPTYREPTDISFVRGRIAGSPSIQRHFGTLPANSSYLLAVLRSKANPADVAQWVKGAPVSIPPAITPAVATIPATASAWKPKPPAVKPRIAAWKKAKRTKKWVRKGKGRAWHRPRRAVVRRW